MKIVILGLSITSSWGNGHATTYRGLVRELVRRGHELLFLERDQPWYAAHRDLPEPPWGCTLLYGSLQELQERHAASVRDADLVIVGSYVPDGVRVGEWVQQRSRGVTAFYDIDTPVTLAKLERGDHEYLHPRQIPHYDLYLSFTGGPTLKRLQREYGAPRARVLYCSFDPQLYFPEPQELQWDLGYMGTYSDDRQASVQAFLLDPRPPASWPASWCGGRGSSRPRVPPCRAELRPGLAGRTASRCCRSRPRRRGRRRTRCAAGRCR